MPALFSKSDERRYELLADEANDSRSARQIFRSLQTLPILASGRVSDAAQRRYRVPSTRSASTHYDVDLIAGTCQMIEGGEIKSCPDKTYNRKSVCVHMRAAIAKEKDMFGGDARLAMKGWDEDPATVRSAA
jgi:hypothetical protein